MRAGFPHSDIYGSKPVCGLPVAFRTLQRPSSPVIAKASTTCTYSLDPITLNPQPFGQGSSQVFLRLAFVPSSIRLEWIRVDTIKTHLVFHASTEILSHPRFRVNHFLYFFQIVKELQYWQKPISKPPRLGYGFLPPIRWWRQTGSNRRPPACKAGALPAELCPRFRCQKPETAAADCFLTPVSQSLIGGSSWNRTNDPRLIKTVL